MSPEMSDVQRNELVKDLVQKSDEIQEKLNREIGMSPSNKLFS